jgi:hypothetical protein
MAVVEFNHAVDAKSAFRGVAYKRLKDSIVYLEMGPLGMFTDAGEGEEGRGMKVAEGVKPITVTPIDGTVAGTGDGTATDGTLGTTLFVKNLSFDTTTEKLTRTFQLLPSFSFARVQTKPDPKRPSERLSMGYGFVGFKTADGAKSALKSLQGFVLDGHALSVQFAQRGVEETKKESGGGVGKARSAKMIVKNVPFEATKKDLRELFGSAHLPSLSWPNLTSRLLRQCSWPSKIPSPPAKIRLQNARICIPRIRLEAGSRKRYGGTQAYSFTRQTFGVGVLGGRGECGCWWVEGEDEERIWERRSITWEEEEVRYGG